MAGAVTLIVELPDDLAYELEAVALRLRRQKSDVVREAIAAHLARYARQVAHVERILAADLAEDATTTHEQVIDWLKAWGGQDPIPGPGTAIRSAIARVVSHPQLGRPGRVEGTHELAVPGTEYTVVYRIVGGRGRILSVIQNPAPATTLS